MISVPVFFLDILKSIHLTTSRSRLVPVKKKEKKGKAGPTTTFLHKKFL